MVEEKIGNRIANLRKEKGWTQNELADKLQVSNKAVSKWESNNGTPSIEFLPELARLFGVTIDYLLVGNKSIVDNNKIDEKDLEENFNILDYKQDEEHYIKNGVVVIDAILETNDSEFIKYMLEKYPISCYEILEKLFRENKYKEIWRFAVDNNLLKLKYAIQHNKEKDILKELENIKYLTPTKSNPLYDIDGFNYKYIPSTENGYKQLESYKDMYGFEGPMKSIKASLLYNVDLKEEKVKMNKGLTKEYFTTELEKGNKDIVIIKLCVKLEAILKCDYRYEGTFEEMLNAFCSKFNTYDDESNDYDPYTPKALNNLRMARNNIVHSNLNVIEFSETDLKFCITYICKLDGEV